MGRKRDDEGRAGKERSLEDGESDREEEIYLFTLYLHNKIWNEEKLKSQHLHWQHGVCE